MGQKVLRAVDLPFTPLDAAARFHAEQVPLVRQILRPGGSGPEVDALVIVFPPAGHEHRGWRLAAVQELAREAAPRRVNGVEGGTAIAIDEVTDWLASAPGVTGQLLNVDAKPGETG